MLACSLAERLILDVGWHRGHHLMRAADRGERDDHDCRSDYFFHVNAVGTQKSFASLTSR